MKHYLQTSILIFIFSICILIQNSFSQQNTNGWYWANGQPQSNPLNWVKIIDATHYYAVGDGGTFMKSSDGGDTWLINSQAGVTDPSFGSGATLRLYSAWFFNANTGILTGQSVANDGGKIRRTTDGGQTFTTIGLGIPPATTYMPPRVYDIYFINSTTGYICGDSVVKSFKTTNAGLTWTLLPNLPNLPSAYNCVYAKDENNIFLGVQSDGYANQRRIVRTTNAGATWKIDTLPGASSYSYNDIEFQNANTGFITGTFNGSYFGYTTNGGTSWTQAIFPTGAAYQLKIIGSTVYALSSNSYCYTTNLGVSWSSISTTDPTNVNQPIGGSAAFDINGNDAIVVGGGGQINISNDAGSTWRNKNYAVGNNSYCFSSVLALRGTSKVWAGAFGGGLILYSPDRGASWVKQQTTAGESFEEIDMINSNTGYAVGGSLNPSSSVGYCYKTTNGGTNWVKLTIPNPTMKRYGLCFVNANTGWVFGGYPFGSSEQIIKTTDGGATWVNQLMTPSHDKTIEDGDFSDANTGYCTFSTNVYKTTNGGTNWNRIDNIPPALYWKKVQTFSNSTLYLGGGQTIYKSTNAGANWNSVNIPSSLASIFNMDWTDLNNGIVVGTQGYTAKTTDGGITWKERNTGTSTLTGISLASEDTAFAACDRNVWGAILRLYDNYNPFSLNLTLAIEGFWDGTAQVSDDVTCHLRNSTAPFNEVEAVTSSVNNSGTGTFTFNNAPSGSYYIEVTHRNSIETWSALPQTYSQGGTFNYNFTTSASQAFGNNMILKSGRYCDYSGDVNQDGAVNLTDLIETYNASSAFTTGYVVTDVDGNNFVDLTDITMIYNNARKFIEKVTP